ncbi:MAG TPA: TIGR04282 family arsenosugar biosynthesis glycosyltransferase [Pyrinomonadaceae bacterium]|nr:TIGR04282 family arsenosugar biosynthesis glycosyltransferase [Pyrinomonadaceae bacterium]
MKTSYPLLDPHAREANGTRGGCALGVMTKAPRAGVAKTRLVPPLTHEEAARLSACFLSDTASNIADACAESSRHARLVHPVAVYTPAGAESAFDGLLPVGFALLAQRGDGLGARLLHAADDLLRLGYESCCLINSDSPTLPRALLAAAAEELTRPGRRLVLGPSDDGGYYLIGLKHAHPRLFAEIDWSTSVVLAQTIERAREIDLDVTLLPAWYDVDDASTLQRLYDELFGAHGDDDACDTPQLVPCPAPHTRAELARLLEGEARARLLSNFTGAHARAEGCG